MANNSEKKIASNNKWTNDHFDRVNLAIPKGGKDALKAAAEKENKSVNKFVVDILFNTSQEVKPSSRPVCLSCDEVTPNSTEECQHGEKIKLTDKTIETAKAAADRTGETIPEFIERAVYYRNKNDLRTAALGDPVSAYKAEVNPEPVAQLPEGESLFEYIQQVKEAINPK